MSLFRLVGIPMSDASDTFGGGIRSYLGAAGFLVMMFGGYFIYEDKDTRIGITLIALGLPLFFLPAIWKYVRRLIAPQSAGTDRGQTLKYLNYRDFDLGGSIVTMARRSAWGRWFAAQHLVGSGQPIGMLSLLQIAGSVVRDEILNGKLEVRGRLPRRMEYETIPRTHWQSSALHFVEDPRTLWKMVVFPADGVEIARDGAIVRASDAAAAARTSQLTEYDSF